jgi:hypothetical protein
MSRPTHTLIAKPAKRTAALGVVGTMIVAALSMWTVTPFAWIWIGSRISDTQQPSAGPYMVVFFGIVASIVATAWVLSLLNRLYVRLTGSRFIASIRPAWLKGMTEDHSTSRATVMETVVVTSVALALLLFVSWFLVIAGSPLPNQ